MANTIRLLRGRRFELVVVDGLRERAHDLKDLALCNNDAAALSGIHLTDDLAPETGHSQKVLQILTCLSAQFIRRRVPIIGRSRLDDRIRTKSGRDPHELQFNMRREPTGFKSFETNITRQSRANGV